jgi:hypothetical protein
MGAFDDLKAGLHGDDGAETFASLKSKVAPAPTTAIGKATQWASTPTPEATSIGDFATRVVPASAGKAAVGIPSAAYGLGKELSQGLSADTAAGTSGGIGNALYYGIVHPNTLKAAWQGVKGIGAFTGEKTGILPPSQTATGDAPLDYGQGLPSSVGQWAQRVGHQVITDPVGVGMAAEGAKGALKPAAKAVAESSPLEAVAGASHAAANKLTDITLKQSSTIKPKTRAQNTQTALEGGFLPNAKGVDSLNAAIADTEQKLQAGIASGDAAQVRGTLDRAIANVESLRDKANRSSDPAKNNALLDAEIERLRTHPMLDESGTVDMGTLQQAKVEQGQEISKKYGQPGYDDFTTQVDKARVRGMKEELESQMDETFPELAATNKKLSEYYALKKVLDHAANRIGRNQGGRIGLPIKSGAGATIGGMLAGPAGAAVGGGIGALIGVIEHPSVAPRLARQLYKLSKGAMTYSEALKSVKSRLSGLVERKRADAVFADYSPPSDPEAYDSSVRTPGGTAPEFEGNATPSEPLGYGERELRPGVDTSIAPTLDAAYDTDTPLWQQKMAGFPKGKQPTPPPRKPGSAADNLYLHRSDGYAEGGMVSHGLRPAVKFKGKQIDGELGQHHADILKANKIGTKQPHTRGFVTPEGKFLNRQEADSWMKENQPAEFDKLDAGAKRELHSQDLPKKSGKKKQSRQWRDIGRELE